MVEWETLLKMSRNPELDMTKSWGSFDTTVKLCINAHNKNNTARYIGLLTTLESSFYKYDMSCGENTRKKP